MLKYRPMKFIIFILLAFFSLAATCRTQAPITEDEEMVTESTDTISEITDTMTVEKPPIKYPSYFGSVHLTRADTSSIIINEIIVDKEVLRDGTLRLLRPIKKEEDQIYFEYTVKKGKVYGIHEEKYIHHTSQVVPPIIFGGQGLNSYPTGGATNPYPLKEGEYALEILIYNREFDAEYCQIISTIDVPAKSTVTPTQFEKHHFVLKYKVPDPITSVEICPLCNKKDLLIPVVYGKPSEEAMKEEEEGKIWLAGCVIGAFMHRAYCKRDSILIE